MIDFGGRRTVAWVTVNFDSPRQQTFEVQVCGLIWLGPIGIPDPQGPGGGGGRRPRQRQPQQHPPCPVAPLTAITDPAAQSFENGNRLNVADLTQNTQTALTCFQNAVQAAGGVLLSIRLTGQTRTKLTCAKCGDKCNNCDKPIIPTAQI